MVNWEWRQDWLSQKESLCPSLDKPHISVLLDALFCWVFCFVLFFSLSQSSGLLLPSLEAALPRAPGRNSQMTAALRAASTEALL